MAPHRETIGNSRNSQRNTKKIPPRCSVLKFFAFHLVRAQPEFTREALKLPT